MSSIDWDKGDGLVPAIVQHATTLQVLMLGYMNREAHDASIERGRVTFYSRSKKRLWTKGESSGHFLKLVEIVADCDRDALLVTALPAGPTCHLEKTSCFGTAEAPGVGFLAHLTHVIETRRAASPDVSYTARLIAEGTPRAAQKVGEEGVEVALAAVCRDAGALSDEAADLVFHLLVLLAATDTSFDDVIETLRRRHARPVLE